MTDYRPIIFQIGFNKTATSALFLLFLGGGHKPLHSSGKFWRKLNHGALINKRPPLLIADNVARGDLPFKGLEDFDSYFDQEAVDVEPIVECFRYYREVDAAYPNAKFVLNIRNVDDWIRSRRRHNNGGYLAGAMKRMATKEEKVIENWRRDFESHTQQVQEYFMNRPQKLLVFNIDTTPINALVDFVAPEFQIKASDWKHIRKTDEIARAKNWDFALKN